MSVKQIKKHVKVLHSDHPREKSHICHVCGKGYAEKNHLQIHLVNHSDEFNFECEVCHKKLKTKYLLEVRNLFQWNLEKVFKNL